MSQRSHVPGGTPASNPAGTPSGALASTPSGALAGTPSGALTGVLAGALAGTPSGALAGTPNKSVPFHIFAEVTSTNDLARQGCKRRVLHGEAFLARRQSAGRGRRGRQWFSPDVGNLYLSVVIAPDLSFLAIPQVTLAAGVLMAESLEEVFGLSVKLKWPNDLIVDQRKLGGILCEGILRGERLLGIIVGVGVNLSADVPFPAELRSTAISAADVLPGSSAKEVVELAKIFVEKMSRELRSPGEGGLASFRERWRRLAWLPADICLPNGAFAVAYDINDSGHLLSCGEDGSVHATSSGEVRWLSLGKK